MVLSDHYFWRHVTGRTRRILCIIFSPNSCNTEICDSHVSIAFDHEVFWLNISVDNILLMNVFKSCDQTRYEKPGSFFVELPMSANVVPQVTSG